MSPSLNGKLLLGPYTGPYWVDHTEDEGYHGFEEEGGVEQQPGQEANQFLTPNTVEQENVAHYIEKKNIS